jgi:hypothetical protein
MQVKATQDFAGFASQSMYCTVFVIAFCVYNIHTQHNANMHVLVPVTFFGAQSPCLHAESHHPVEYGGLPTWKTEL